MKLYVLLIAFLIPVCKIQCQEAKCDYDFHKTIEKTINQGFNKCEKDFQSILLMCPDHYLTHSAIISHYEETYTTIPLFALLMQNTIDYDSDNAIKNINKINRLFHRYLTIKRKEMTVNVPQKFVQDLYADYNNNMSPLETGLINAGAVDYSQFKDLNSAERMIIKFDQTFSRIDKIRPHYHGFYWDFYVDFFINLYKSEHFKTAMYLVMYKTGEEQIVNWITDNPEKIKLFYTWKENYFLNLKNKQ